MRSGIGEALRGFASAEGGGGHGFDPMHHVSDSPYWDLSNPLAPDFKIPLDFIHSGPLQTSLTTFFLWLVAGILLIFLWSVANNRRAHPRSAPRGGANAVEALVVFIRDEIVYPNLGHHAGRKLLPYFLSLFFFIVTANYVGMIPGSFTITGQITVTCALALVSFGFMFIGGFYVHGAHFLAHLVPFKVEKGPLMPVMIPVWCLVLVLELLGMVIKSFVLMMRLHANMMAGHLVILSLLMLPFTYHSYGWGAFGVSLALVINFLELLVAFLQAYVFVLLSAIFIGHSVNAEHH
ncbi:MAG: F0F1 ATP synthase subunit A [Planctomycetota bacterium]